MRFKSKAVSTTWTVRTGSKQVVENNRLDLQTPKGNHVNQQLANQLVAELKRLYPGMIGDHVTDQGDRGFLVDFSFHFTLNVQPHQTGIEQPIQDFKLFLGELAIAK
jgi:hypothetical protein